MSGTKYRMSTPVHLQLQHVEQSEGDRWWWEWCWRVSETYELGERFPSGLIFCCATPSLMTTGSLADVALVVADAEVLLSIGEL